MKTSTDRDLPDRAAAYGLVASAVVALLPHFTRLPWWLSLAILAVTAWRVLVLRRGWPAPGRGIRILLVGAGVLAIFGHYGTLFGRDAGSALLAAMMALKLLELRQLRDYMLALFLIYFLIAVGFLYSQEVWLVLYLGAAFVATSATLVRLSRPGLSGRRALRIALVLLVQALPLMLIMHLLFPRLQGSLWGVPRDAFAGRTGLSEQMRPGSIHELSRSDEVAFRAYFPGEIPKASDRYWRAVVLTRTDGRTWTRDFSSGTAPHDPPDGLPLPYTLFLEPSGKPWVPVLEYPAHWPAGLLWHGGATLVAAQPIHGRRVYDLGAYLGHRPRTITNPERQASLRLPPVSNRVSALARQLRGGGNGLEAVQSALAYFRQEQFFYTLEPPLLGEHPVDEFLFETRRGYCEHFAAAFVVLMRAAGLPARVVTGYQGGELNPANQSLVVRQSDAHAWTEVWLPARGWVRVDPTAAVAPERIELGADGVRRLIASGLQPGTAAAIAYRPGWLERLQRRTWLALDTVQSAWQRWVLSYDAARQRQFLSRIGAGNLRSAQLVGLLAFLVALVIGIYLVLARQRPPPADPALRQYRRLCRKLGRVGLARLPHEGPQDFLGRAANERPDLARTLGQLAEMYTELRYGRTPHPGLLADFSRKVALLRPSPR